MHALLSFLAPVLYINQRLQLSLRKLVYVSISHKQFMYASAPDPTTACELGSGTETNAIIIESVVSAILCRDTKYTQYMPTQKISPNLRNGTLISLYNHIYTVHVRVFHGQQDSSHQDKPSRKYHTGYSQNGQIVFFLSFFFSFFLSSTLPQSLMMVYTRNSSILH